MPFGIGVACLLAEPTIRCTHLGDRVLIVVDCVLGSSKRLSYHDWTGIELAVVATRSGPRGELRP